MNYHVITHKSFMCYNVVIHMSVFYDKTRSMYYYRFFML